MKVLRLYWATVVQGAILLLSLLTDTYDSLVLTLVASLFLTVIDKIGKGVVLRELISFHSSFICLAMPLLGYKLYNQENALAVLWQRYMPIAESTYFTFALPAVSAFTLALTWPFSIRKVNDHEFVVENLLVRIKANLYRQNMSKIGIRLMLIGIAMFFASRILPIQLRFVSLLFYFTSFAGFLYIYFLPAFRNKTLVLSLFVVFVLGNAIRSGMFTIVVYMGLTMFSLLFIGFRISLLKKLSIVFAGIFVLLIVQSIKPDYRGYTWRKGYEGSKISLFYNLVRDRINQGDFLTEEAYFPIYYRTNQGFNVALVMRRVPANQPHDNGEVLLKNIAASVVPRIFWPDKPLAGGKFNMEYYAGFKIQGWSTNIGPLGEAYGGFGVTGGIIYMFVLGWLIRWVYGKIFKMSYSMPLLLCWIPVVFYQVTYSAETDTLQILNSLIKSGFFVFLIYKIFPSWFGIQEISSPHQSRTIKPENKVLT